jgi:hypothetical protein
VTFTDNGATLGTGTVSNGTATFSTSSLAVGNHPIVATYGSDTNFKGSASSTLNQAVSQASSPTTVSSSPSSPQVNQPVTFTATVVDGSPSSTSPAAGPTGSVQFQIDGANFGTPVTLVNGSATSGSTSWSTVGSHTITAIYSGDTNFKTSTGTLAEMAQYNVGPTSSTGFLQPVNDTAHAQVCGSPCPESVFKAGSTIPFKFQLHDFTGKVIGPDSGNVTFAAVDVGAATGTIDDTSTATSPDSGNLFRWDSTSQQYIYNWKMPNTSGRQYRITATINSTGQTLTVYIIGK